MTAQAASTTQPTVSTQVRLLERALGERLFERRGRGLVLTDAGRLAYRYAEDIFTLGREFQDVLAGRPTGRPARLTVGITDAVPKLIAFRLLEPVRRMPDPPALVCRDDAPSRLLAATSRGLIGSPDVGRTWVQSTLGSSDEVLGLAAAPDDRNLVVAATRSGFYRSHDGGDTCARVVGAAGRDAACAHRHAIG